MKKIILHQYYLLLHLKNVFNTCLKHQNWIYTIKYMSTMNNKHNIITKLSKESTSSWWLSYCQNVGFSILQFTICNIYFLSFFLYIHLYIAKNCLFHMEHISWKWNNQICWRFRCFFANLDTCIIVLKSSMLFTWWYDTSNQKEHHHPHVVT